ncbi:MAG: restriction endonuclease [Thermosphaera sp.]|nr:restriction endonuclease [Thermosphaera sp.]
MGSQPVRRRAKDLLEDVVAEALESLGFTIRVDHRVQGRAGEVEVDVWGEKLVEGARFTVYASCKNWDGPVDVGTVREELGRVLQMTVIPHVRILVAPSFTEPARREALADGFIVVEVGEKAREDNIDRIYSRVYHKLDRIFTGVAPRRLQELAEKVRELAERARRIAEEARRSSEEIEGVRAELERMAATTRPPEPPAPAPPTPPPTSQPKPPEAPRSVLDEAFDRLGVSGDFRRRVKRLLLHAYTTCYVLYEDLVYANRYERRAVGDVEAYLFLKQLGLVDLARDSREKRDEVIIKNKDVVAELAREHVESVREDLRKLVEEYGWEVALMASMKGSMSFAHESFEPELFTFELLKPEGLPLPPRRVAVALGAFKPLLMRRYSEFWSRLRGLGLAFECSWGGLGASLRLLPEARNAIMEITKDKLEEFSGRGDVVKRLAVLNVLYHYFPFDVEHDRYFKQLLDELGLGLEDLAEVAEGLHRRGLVSHFTTTPPYMVVYDVGAFRKAIIEEIEQLYSQAVRP